MRDPRIGWKSGGTKEWFRCRRCEKSKRFAPASKLWKKQMTGAVKNPCVIQHLFQESTVKILVGTCLKSDIHESNLSTKRNLVGHSCCLSFHSVAPMTWCQTKIISRGCFVGEFVVLLVLQKAVISESEKLRRKQSQFSSI